MLRDYGVDGQIGLEPTMQGYIDRMVAVFGQVRRVLRDDGTCWLNIGDSYNGYPANVGKGEGLSSRNQHARKYIESGYGLRNKTLKPKDLCLIPFRLALALQDDGWWVRSDIVWAKPNPMPESVTDRPTSAWEHVFLLSKSNRYYYDLEAVREPPRPGNNGISRAIARTKNGPVDLGNGAVMAERKYDEIKGPNLRNVWAISTKPYSGAHFAVFPPELPTRCIKAGTKSQDTVLDPFFGSGTTGAVAQELDRRWVGIELNEQYCELAKKRIEKAPLPQLELAV